MTQEAGFWRNVGLIGAAHVVLLFGIFRWGSELRKPLTTNIVWMSSVASAVGATEPAQELSTPPAATPEPTPAEAEEEEEVATPAPTAAASEMALPSATPVSTPEPTPSATATPKPKATPQPKATPKPKAASSKKNKAKSSPREKTPPKAKPKPSPAGAKKTAPSVAPEKSGGSGASAGKGSGPGDPSRFNWYGNMLHDRFFGAWVQPKTAEATGSRMSTLVLLRIEKDGRVSKFNIVRSSGNVVVDESVAAVAKQVTRVDPLPSGLAPRGYYDVKINFELNVE